MSHSKKFKIIAAVLALVVALSAFAACGKKDDIKPDDTSTPSQTEAPAVSGDINPLTGLSGLSESAQGKRPVAVVVENSPEARPQWGLCSPDVVIEGLAEGGITRMLWLYSDISKAGKIGPTRSARHNFVEMAASFDTIYVHFGGSYVAYNLFSSDSSLNHIDGNKGEGKYFQRDKSRKAPHNACTTGEQLSKAISDKKFRTDIDASHAKPFNFASEKRTLANPCGSVQIKFSESYKHTFTYNSTDGLYYNNMNSKPMVDSDGKQMAVNNVIIIYSNVTLYKNDAKLVEWNLSEGKGLYVSNGTYEEITWKKGSTHNQLKLYSADGSELKINTGKTYMGFVPSSNSSATLINA